MLLCYSSMPSNTFFSFLFIFTIYHRHIFAIREDSRTIKSLYMDCTQQHNTPVGIIYSDLLGKLTWCADDPAQTNAGVNGNP